MSDWNEAFEKLKGRYVMLTMVGRDAEGPFCVYGLLAEVRNGFVVITSDKPGWKPLVVNVNYVQTFRECKKPEKSIKEEPVF